jgi:hypothetical protein
LLPSSGSDVDFLTRDIACVPKIFRQINCDSAAK